jgi:hypothetical protein
MTMHPNFSNDIPFAVAIAAHSGTSWDPEKRGRAECDEYAQTMAQDFEALSTQANKGGTLDLFAAEFEEYRAGYAKRFRAYLYSRSRLVSSFIAGPSNFPARRMQKRGDASHKRLVELLDFRARAKRAILRKLRPDLAPIRANDSDAIARYQVELSKLSALQQRMKAANAAIRANKKHGAPAQVLALVNLGFYPGLAARLLERDSCGRIGFADYEFTNNGANMRRIAARIEEIEKFQEKAQSGDIDEAYGDVRIVQAFSDNRIRIVFPGKPAESVRAQLRASGFKWSPTKGAWQRFCNDSALWSARQIAKSLAT